MTDLTTTDQSVPVGTLRFSPPGNSDPAHSDLTASSKPAEPLVASPPFWRRPYRYVRMEMFTYRLLRPDPVGQVLLGSHLQIVMVPNYVLPLAVKYLTDLTTTTTDCNGNFLRSISSHLTD